MSSSTDPENLPPRRAREDETTRNASYRDAAADDAATRSMDQAPTRPRERDYSPAPSAEREYQPAPTRATPVVGPVADPTLANRETAVARQKERFGGIKVGSAFFGWLTATGMAVLLTALVAAAGTAVGLANNTDVNATVTSGNES